MKETRNSIIDVEEFILKDDGLFPNNVALPVLIYKQAVDTESSLFAFGMEKMFAKNNWQTRWRNGIYDYHHYHSLAHEALGIFRGSIVILLGGENGIIQKLQQGDVIVIPAGVAHKCIECSDDFKCVGAYPEYQKYDMNYGYEGERPLTDRNIANVPLPDLDPVFGLHGPLMNKWINKTELKIVS